MTLETLVQAAPGMRKLTQQDLPIREAYAVVRLIDRVNPLLRFAGEEEIKAAGNEQRLQELWALEPEELDGLQPLELHAGEGLRLSPADLKCLEPLVHFVDLGGEEKWQ